MCSSRLWTITIFTSSDGFNNTIPGAYSVGPGSRQRERSNRIGKPTAPPWAPMGCCVKVKASGQNAAKPNQSAIAPTRSTSADTLPPTEIAAHRSLSIPRSKGRSASPESSLRMNEAPGGAVGFRELRSLNPTSPPRPPDQNIRRLRPPEFMRGPFPRLQHLPHLRPVRFLLCVDYSPGECRPSLLISYTDS
jgi:hypothetical protein